MSRFIDKLNQVSKAAPQPIGFRAGQPASQKPKILLVASLAQTNVDNMADHVAGADAGLLHISKSGLVSEDLQRMIQAVPDIPWGGWLGDIDSEGIKRITDAGFDFVVFPAANTPLAILRSDKLGRILQVEASLKEGLLKAVDELPVDAVFIATEKEEGALLTWHHLMIFQRFADLLAKPLLISVPSSVTASELQVLWGAGVHGVIVEVGANQPEERLKELRQAIDKLTFPSKRKRGKPEALLPYINSEERDE